MRAQPRSYEADWKAKTHARNRDQQMKQTDRATAKQWRESILRRMLAARPFLVLPDKAKWPTGEAIAIAR